MTSLAFQGRAPLWQQNSVAASWWRGKEEESKFPSNPQWCHWPVGRWWPSPVNPCKSDASNLRRWLDTTPLNSGSSFRARFLSQGSVHLSFFFSSSKTHWQLTSSPPCPCSVREDCLMVSWLASRRKQRGFRTLTLLPKLQACCSQHFPPTDRLICTSHWYYGSANSHPIIFLTQGGKGLVFPGTSFGSRWENLIKAEMLFSNHLIQNLTTPPRFNAMCHSHFKPLSNFKQKRSETVKGWYFG